MMKMKKLTVLMMALAVALLPLMQGCGAAPETEDSKVTATDKAATDKTTDKAAKTAADKTATTKTESDKQLVTADAGKLTSTVTTGTVKTDAAKTETKTATSESKSSSGSSGSESSTPADQSSGDASYTDSSADQGGDASYTDSSYEPEPSQEPAPSYTPAPTTAPAPEPAPEPEAPAHVHSYTETVIEPTCTSGGYTLHTCACGDSYRDNEHGALGHDYQPVYETRTVEKRETQYRIFCNHCGSDLTSLSEDEIWDHCYSHADEPNAKIGWHDDWVEVVVGTETEQVIVGYTCSRCGATKTP